MPRAAVHGTAVDNDEEDEDNDDDEYNVTATEWFVVGDARQPLPGGNRIADTFAEVSSALDTTTTTTTTTSPSWSSCPTPTRIDRVLSARFPEPSRTYFQYLITQRAVRVNDCVVTRKSHKVAAGDRVRVRFLLPPGGIGGAGADDDHLVPEDLPLDVLYEDESILVLNKRSDMVVHPAPGNWRGTLANALAHRFGRGGIVIGGDTDHHHHDDDIAARRREQQHLRAGIVHRLDKGTSGVMVVAKSADALRRLQAEFAARRVHKEYVAVVAGSGGARSLGVTRTVEAPIGRHPTRRTEMAIASEARRGGRSAVSHFTLLPPPPVTPTPSKPADYAVAHVRIETGRTHQVRVHARHINAPVLGDPVYGFAAYNQRYRAAAARPLLHAWRLAFAHPRTNQWSVFEAPLPGDMQRFTAHLGATVGARPTAAADDAAAAVAAAAMTSSSSSAPHEP